VATADLLTGTALATPAAPAAAAAAPGGGDRSGNSGLGIVALVGAGGAALLRMRQATTAAGIADAGTLTALGHSAATFWAGSCTAVGGSSALAVPGGASAGTAAATPLAFTPASTPGGHTRLRDAITPAVVENGSGGRVVPAALGLGSVGDVDRTGIVTLLLAASMALGAAAARVLPPRRLAHGREAG
jgi:hypothetical protein